jgi:hypothetical protein
MSSCLTSVRAVARLHGKATIIVDGKVESVGTARLCWYLAVQTVRLAIAAALCYGGSKFIANTIALGDLILNCVALEVRESSHSPSIMSRSRLPVRPWTGVAWVQPPFARSVCLGGRRGALLGLLPGKAEADA